MYDTNDAGHGTTEALRVSAPGRHLRGARVAADAGWWADWNSAGACRYTLGVEEELMLLNPLDRSLSPCSDSLLGQLSDELGEHVSPETHAAVIELQTGIHLDVARAAAELASLRRRLALELGRLGVVGAVAGTHPLVSSGQTRLSGGRRYRQIGDSMRSLATREPTMALHVHVGVPCADDAIRLLDRLRETLPLLLALSANSPFVQGRDSGFASARTVLFGGFPRTGIPRGFTCYAEYVDAVDGLVASGALPGPTFVWWDTRLQPALGTVEVRVMDAQSRVSETAALIALVQSLARLELEGEPRGCPAAPEVIAENHFLAARDGLDAWLIDPVARRLVPVGVLIDGLLEACRPHAGALGCAAELQDVTRLAAGNGARRQRMWVRAGHDLTSMLSMLGTEFARNESPFHSAERSDLCVAGSRTQVHPSG